MADERRTKLKERTHLPKLKLDAGNDAGNPPGGALDPVQKFLQRKDEVTQQDHQEFSANVQEKSARDRQQAAPVIDAPPAAPARINRRSLLKWAAGTTAAGEAVAYAYQTLTESDVPAHGVMHSGATSAAAQRRCRPSSAAALMP